MTAVPLILAVVLLVAASLLLSAARRQQKASGLPGGRVIYTDTRAWGPVEKPLYDPRLGLAGKPDYLVDKNGQLIPVEVKSSRAPAAPYDSHIFQLAAYCRLVEHTYGQRPPYGILHYADRTFAIDYTVELENALAATLAQIRACGRGGRPRGVEHGVERGVDRSHEQAGRCSRCGYRTDCDQRLA